MDKILIIGSGGHAKSCIEVIESQNKYNIEGIIKNEAKETNENFLGYKVLGDNRILEKLSKKYKFAFIGIGQIKSADKRVELFNKLLNLGFYLPVIIAPSSIVSKRANIQDGTIIMNQTLINSDTYIGENCIINNKALIEHDVSIGKNCHISTGAIVNGSAKIEDNCFIGSNATIMQGIKIGSGSIVSAGSFVNKDLSKDSLFKNHER